jgi:hypothetical protein
MGTSFATGLPALANNNFFPHYNSFQQARKASLGLVDINLHTIKVN